MPRLPAKELPPKATLTVIPLAGGSIPFDPYGPTSQPRFLFCPVWKRGRLVELYIDPRYQDRYAEQWFKVDLGTFKAKELRFTGFPIDRVGKLDLGNWCFVHKCFRLLLYAPPEASSLGVESHFGTDIWLTFR